MPGKGKIIYRTLIPVCPDSALYRKKRDGVMKTMKELGNWITNHTAVPFYARKVFEVPKKILSAKAKVCGLGQFIFYVNGQKAGDHELDPGWTNYRKLIQYVTFDITDYLKEGKNAVGAEVGNGWFIKMDEHYTFAFPPFMPPNPNPYQPFGKSLILAMQLEWVCEDGTKGGFGADVSFQVKEHPVVMSNVYGSETIDGRKCKEGFSTPEFDASDWESASVVLPADEPGGRLAEQFQPAVKVIQTYPGKLINVFPKAGISREIYDLGQNMSGILEFEVKGRAGDEIRFYPAEKLDADGDVDQMAKNWIQVDSCITYIIGRDDVWEKGRMKFTYFAGRYIAVEGAVHAGKSGVTLIRSLCGHAISSAYEKSGSFSCDDTRYGQIYDLVEKAVEANMLSVHTDCPTIERFAWQEPNHLMAPSIFYMKNGKKLWEKFLLDMRTDQHSEEDFFYDMEGEKVYPGEGLMPSQCPCYIPNVLPVPGMGSFYDIIAWGSTCILGTYWHYRFYGDVQIIEDNYEAGKRYLNHLKTKVNKDGFLNHGLGDWGNPKNDLTRENIETAILYADTVTLAKFAGILGRHEEQSGLLLYAEQVKENYNKKLLVKHPGEGFWCYRAWDHENDIFLTQAGQALPLFWGMVPEDKKTDVVKALRHTLEKEGAFICGEVGMPYVIQSARQYGMNDLIAEFIMKKEHPSYYAFVLDGETTLGEYWETNPRSHCHDMMGHIIEWYYNGIAGIIPGEPGFRSLLIQPYLPGGMQRFSCTYQSAGGEILVEAEEYEHEICLKIRVPEGMPVEINTENLKQKNKEILIRQRVGTEAD